MKNEQAQKREKTIHLYKKETCNVKVSRAKNAGRIPQKITTGYIDSFNLLVVGWKYIYPLKQCIPALMASIRNKDASKGHT